MGSIGRGTTPASPWQSETSKVAAAVAPSAAVTPRGGPAPSIWQLLSDPNARRFVAGSQADDVSVRRPRV